MTEKQTPRGPAPAPRQSAAKAKRAVRNVNSNQPQAFSFYIAHKLKTLLLFLQLFKLNYNAHIKNKNYGLVLIRFVERTQIRKGLGWRPHCA